MTRPTLHPVHGVLHRPLRVAWIDARLMLLALLGAVLATNVAERFTRWDIPVGILAFLIGYGVAWVITRREPAMVPILLIRLRYLLTQGLWRLPTRFDPLHHDRVVIRLR